MSLGSVEFKFDDVACMHARVRNLLQHVEKIILRVKNSILGSVICFGAVLTCSIQRACVRDRQIFFFCVDFSSFSKRET